MTCKSMSHRKRVTVAASPLCAKCQLCDLPACSNTFRRAQPRSTAGETNAWMKQKSSRWVTYVHRTFRLGVERNVSTPLLEDVTCKSSMLQYSITYYKKSIIMLHCVMLVFCPHTIFFKNDNHKKCKASQIWILHFWLIFFFFILLQNQQKTSSEDLSHATATSKTFIAKACKVLFSSATYKQIGK